MTTEQEYCGALPPGVGNGVPCYLEPDHQEMHFSTSGCAGSEVRWPHDRPRAEVPQFFGAELYEHYQADGYLLVATTDASVLTLEPGDFIVRRSWSTGVVPYIYRTGGES